MNQSIVVVSDNQSYKAIGNITREILHESDSAAAVIQSAIDQFAGSGGQVVLENGDFALDHPVKLANNITLRGAGRGTRLVVKGYTGIVCEKVNVSNSVLISGCRTFQITGAAVVVEDSHEFNLSSNIFCWHTEHGVTIRNARWGAIVGNEVIDTGSWNSGLPVVNQTPAERLPAEFEPFNGIHMLNVHGYSVTGNTIFNWQVCPPMQHGIYEDVESGDNAITGNNINFFTGKSVASLGQETVVSSNVALGGKPHLHWTVLEDQLQSFDTSLTLALVAVMKT